MTNAEHDDQDRIGHDQDRLEIIWQEATQLLSKMLISPFNISRFPAHQNCDAVIVQGNLDGNIRAKYIVIMQGELIRGDQKEISLLHDVQSIVLGYFNLAGIT